jgi:hypothetical protein
VESSLRNAHCKRVTAGPVTAAHEQLVLTSPVFSESEVISLSKQQEIFPTVQTAEIHPADLKNNFPAN